MDRHDPPLTLKHRRTRSNGQKDKLTVSANDHTVAILLVAVLGMCLLAFILKGP